MKTIIDNATRTSKYLIADDYEVRMLNDKIEMGDTNNLDFVIADLNRGNATIIEGVSEPDDWFGNKYTCSDDGTLTVVDGWVDPRIEAEE